MTPTDRRRPRMGLRSRIALASAVAVTIPLLLAVLVLGTILHRVVTSTLVSDAVEESQRVAALVSAVGPGIVATPASGAADARVQVVDADGHVVAATVPDVVPFADVAPAPGTTTVTGAADWWTPGAVNDDDLVAASPVVVRGEVYSVLVAVSQAQASRSVNAVAGTLTAAVPILVAATAAAIAVAVGRTLRQVDGMRRRVAGIDGDPASLGVRVPVPDTRDEIHDLATTMNDMLDRLERSRAAQRAFVSDAGHELRSPLATLAAAVELGAADPDEWPALTPLIRTETERMTWLVDALLVLSRADDGALALERGDVDLDEIVRAEVDRVRSTTPLGIERRAAPARTTGDRRRLGAVVRNLVDNAARHAEARIRLTTTTLGDGTAEIVVEDDGPGVPPNERDRIFERFVRLDDARSRDAGGSGLGLAIVRELVAAHGGHVRVDQSTDLGGAAFVVSLPSADVASTSR